MLHFHHQHDLRFCSDCNSAYCSTCEQDWTQLKTSTDKPEDPAWDTEVKSICYQHSCECDSPVKKGHAHG